MEVSEGLESQPRAAVRQSYSARAMAFMGGVFALTALAALAMALLLEAPAADELTPDSSAGEDSPVTSAPPR